MLESRPADSGVRVKIAANISFLFTELAPLARIAAARHAGFDGVELLFPYDLDPEAVGRELRAYHDRAAQYARRAGLRADDSRAGRGCLTQRCAAERGTAARSVSQSDHGRRSDVPDPPVRAADPARPDRRRAGSERARSRR